MGTRKLREEVEKIERARKNIEKKMNYVLSLGLPGVGVGLCGYSLNKI